MENKNKTLTERLPVILSQEQRVALLEDKVKRAEEYARKLAEQAKRLKYS
jgi:hypothetical protein